MQWGQATASSGTVTVTFPTAFSTASIGLAAIGYNTSNSGSNYNMNYNSLTKTGFVAIQRTGGGSAGSTKFTWVAIGY